MIGKAKSRVSGGNNRGDALAPSRAYTSRTVILQARHASHRRGSLIDNSPSSVVRRLDGASDAIFEYKPHGTEGIVAANRSTVLVGHKRIALIPRIEHTACVEPKVEQ